MKRGIGYLTLGAVLGISAVLGGKQYVTYTQSPAYINGRELDRIVEYILPPKENTIFEYTLENGKKAWLRNVNKLDSNQLQINTNGVEFISEDWDYGRLGIGGPAGDARILDRILVDSKGKWNGYSRNEIQNYPAWQDAYETLIRQVAAAKKQQVSTHMQKVTEFNQ